MADDPDLAMRLSPYRKESQRAAPCGSPQLSEQMNVTLVTANADADELSADDYREMFDELKQGHSLSQLVALIGSQFSRALWNQYERGETAVTPDAQRTPQGCRVGSTAADGGRGNRNRIARRCRLDGW